MSSVRLKKYFKNGCILGTHIHTIRCYEPYKNNQSKIRGFTLRIRRFLHQFIKREN